MVRPKSPGLSAEDIAYMTDYLEGISTDEPVYPLERVSEFLTEPAPLGLPGQRWPWMAGIGGLLTSPTLRQAVLPAAGAAGLGYGLYKGAQPAWESVIKPAGEWIGKQAGAVGRFAGGIPGAIAGVPGAIAGLFGGGGDRVEGRAGVRGVERATKGEKRGIADVLGEIVQRHTELQEKYGGERPVIVQQPPAITPPTGIDLQRMLFYIETGM